MNKTVAHYISELLFLHDCVIVPDFGGFVGNKKPAQLNRSAGLLTPPSKQILFNTNLKKNDGLLIAHIADQEEITQEEAQKQVQIFSKASNEKLSSSKVLRILKVGLFTIGHEGNVIFTQDSATNYNLNAYGMSPAYKKVISRKNETERQVKATVRNIKNTPKKAQLIFRAAAVIIPLVTLSYLGIYQQERINNVYSQMTTLGPFNSLSSNEINETMVSNKKTTLAIKIDNKPITNVIKKEKIATVITKKTYYIIAGAFNEKKNANKMHKKLVKWNYKSDILKEGNLLRVSYNSFNNREDAVLALNKIKQQNPEAWLLTK